MRRAHYDPEVRAALMASRWAERIGLPSGNLWEPAIARHALAEWRRLGACPSAWALVEAIMCRQLGLSVEVSR